MNEFKVGLFAIATMISVVVMSLKITSNQSGFGDYITYRTIVRDASGIFPKTTIRVAGISAGRINRIELQGNNALITFEVLDSVKVSTDSILKIRSVGFLGDKYLEIFIGRSDKRLDEHGLITSDEGGGVEDLVKDASQVMKDVKVIVENLKDSIAPVGQEAPVKKILRGVQEIVDNTKAATESLKNVMSGNEEKLNNMIANLEEFSDKLAFHTDEQLSGSAMKDVKDILANAEDMTNDLKEMMSDVKAGKGTLGKILVEDEIADEVKETLAGVKKLVGKVGAIRTEISAYTGVNSEFGGETSATLRIFPSPERFYLLGITTSDFGPEKETHTTTVTNGVSSNEVRTVKTKDQYRFDIQLGRQIHDWAFRGGIIESTGGIGVDYKISSIGTKISMDIYDYREDIGVNLRLASEIQLWNVFYGRIAGEDLLEDSRSATLSAGLKFNDEDLKGLLGFFL